MRTRITVKNKWWEINIKEYNMSKNQALDWLRVHYWDDYEIVKVEEYKPTTTDAIKFFLDRFN